MRSGVVNSVMGRLDPSPPTMRPAQGWRAGPRTVQLGATSLRRLCISGYSINLPRRQNPLIVLYCDQATDDGESWHE
jgi:hypothetical protein